MLRAPLVESLETFKRIQSRAEGIAFDFVLREPLNVKCYICLPISKQTAFNDIHKRFRKKEKRRDKKVFMLVKNIQLGLSEWILS